jgi:hypothetical protein
MWWIPLRDWFSKFACLLFILGAFAKLREASISFAMSVCLSVCLSVRMEQLGSHWTDFHDTWFVSIFRNYVEKFKIHYNLTRITGTLHEDLCTFLIIFLSFLLTRRNFVNKFVEKIKTRILCSISSCFRKLCCSWDNVEKYCRDGQATNDNMAHAHFTLGTWSYKHNWEHAIVLFFFHCNNGCTNPA